jgi:phospholipid/cholesterol/gamma-HCH transport system substrate-binding protein
VRRALALTVAVTIGLTACGLGQDDQISVEAAFADVGDLAPSAPVMLADVQIGKVEDISLSGNHAVVTMQIDRSADVPKGVVARIRRTSLLGERIVDLFMPEDLPQSAPPLQDGDTIAETETRADLEDLVREGVDVLTPIAASEVATLVDEGAKAFGGRGDELRALLQNFERIIEAYAARTDDIRGVIVSLGRFNTILAQQALAHARSVANSAQAIGILRQEVERLERAITALDRLAVGARRILEEHSDEMHRFFRQMRVILRVLRQEEASINKIIRWAPHHNQGTQLTEYKDFVQVYQDLVVCGLNDDPRDPARRCPPQEEPSP